MALHRHRPGAGDTVICLPLLARVPVTHGRSDAALGSIPEGLGPAIPPRTQSNLVRGARSIMMSDTVPVVSIDSMHPYTLWCHMLP